MTCSDFFFCPTATLKSKKYSKRRRRATANLYNHWLDLILLILIYTNRSRGEKMIWTLYNNSCCCVGVCSAGWSRWCLEFISLLTFFSLSLHRQTCSRSSVSSSRLPVFLFSALVPVCPESLSVSLSLCSITSFHHRSLFISLSRCVTCLRSLMCPDVKGEATQRNAVGPHGAFLKSRVIPGEDGETGLNVAEMRTSLGWRM